MALIYDFREEIGVDCEHLYMLVWLWESLQMPLTPQLLNSEEDALLGWKQRDYSHLFLV